MKTTKEGNKFGRLTQVAARRRLPCYAAGVIVCVCLQAMPVSAGADAGEGSKLNVVLVISDDHGWRDSAVRQ